MVHVIPCIYLTFLLTHPQTSVMSQKDFTLLNLNIQTDIDLCQDEPLCFKFRDSHLEAALFDLDANETLMDQKGAYFCCLGCETISSVSEQSPSFELSVSTNWLSKDKPRLTLQVQIILLMVMSTWLKSIPPVSLSCILPPTLLLRILTKV